MVEWAKRNRLVVAGGGLVVIVAAVLAIVLLSGGSATKTKGSTTSPTVTLPPGAHGQFINAQGRTLTFDRGTVSAIGPSAITVQHPDGSKVSLTVSPTTRFRPRGYQPTVGDAVEVRSYGATATAVRHTATG